MGDARPRGNISYDNSGRIAVVSGGCSGIGRAICEGFANSNAAGVVCLDVDKVAGENLPDGIDFYHCDTSDEQQCHEAIAWTIDRFGAVDVLVNNAAIQPTESYVPLHELPADVWSRLIAINFSGYTYLAKHALRHMQAQQSGVVVNIASGQGHRTAKSVGTYGPIKAANIMQARQWGIEYARDGIRVVSVSPGAINTPMVRANLSQQGGEAVIANRHPVGRLGTPEEVANAVLWLASADASFITGTDLEVDGGLGAFAAFANPYPMPGEE